MELSSCSSPQYPATSTLSCGAGRDRWCSRSYPTCFSTSARSFGRAIASCPISGGDFTCLWSLHPKYLDSKGLVALWREGLLAKKVLEGKTRSYRNHPPARALQKPS
ncbi:pyrimidine dimer DNA glycosylase/endonuclease V [Pyrococcus furiosus]|uniref:pyrimidine dimer DNA glycosylase/endonuclease V n=1 Tax=Pyrococcus furiosus TaxID=2261 RepID=UPI001CB788E9|nr:pyrimidine dimer DNA glycosylase/endonuclease V [Pyrococcus furiosus]